MQSKEIDTQLTNISSIGGNTQHLVEHHITD